MATVADTIELRETLDQFVEHHVIDAPDMLAARVLRDEEGEFLAVAVRPGSSPQLPRRFQGLRVITTERAPGQVAAGPLR
jgi:hypothetical protein